MDGSSVGFLLLAREVYQVYVGRDFWVGTMLIPVFVSSYYLNFLCTFPVNFDASADTESRVGLNTKAVRVPKTTE